MTYISSAEAGKIGWRIVSWMLFHFVEEIVPSSSGTFEGDRRVHQVWRCLFGWSVRLPGEASLSIFRFAHAPVCSLSRQEKPRVSAHVSIDGGKHCEGCKWQDPAIVDGVPTEDHFQTDLRGI